MMNEVTATNASDSGTPVDAGLTPAEREALRAQLVADAGRAAEQEASLAASFEAIVEAAELVNTDDEHDPEGTTIAFERAQVTALHRQAQADQEAIQVALQRLDDVGFGLCEDCGQPIGTARLHALPASTRCVQCA